MNNVLRNILVKSILLVYFCSSTQLHQTGDDIPLFTAAAVLEFIDWNFIHQLAAVMAFWICYCLSIVSNHEER